MLQLHLHQQTKNLTDCIWHANCLCLFACMLLLVCVCVIVAFICTACTACVAWQGLWVCCWPPLCATTRDCTRLISGATSWVTGLRSSFCPSWSNPKSACCTCEWQWMYAFITLLWCRRSSTPRYNVIPVYFLFKGYTASYWQTTLRCLVYLTKRIWTTALSFHFSWRTGGSIMSIEKNSLKRKTWQSSLLLLVWWLARYHSTWKLWWEACKCSSSLIIPLIQPCHSYVIRWQQERWHDLICQQDNLNIKYVFTSIIHIIMLYE